MIVPLLLLVLGCVILAYIPIISVVTHGHRREPPKRPVNEVLADAVVEGRLSMERFEELIDEVHRSMPDLDAPYPLVRDE